jgi:hypothetical protein
MVCGGPITVHQKVRSGTCDKPECQREGIRRDLQKIQVAERRRRERFAAEFERVAREDKLERPEPLTVGVLPANVHDPEKTPEDRVAVFREHLRGLVTAALASEEADDAEPLAEPEGVEAPPPLVVHGCAACSGHCCVQGREHAFLDQGAVRRYVREHDERDAGRVEEAWLSRVAERSYEGSCVFHGPRGCVLPRRMRGRECNTFLCSKLMALEGEIDSDEAAAAWVTACDGDRGVRSIFLDLRSGEVRARRGFDDPS